jgi:pimeloyl-ACP methyl ester carboxylesterase
MTVVHSAAYNYDGFGPGFGGDKSTPEMVEAHPQFWLDDHMKKSPQKEQWKKFVRDHARMMSVKEIVPENKLKQIRNSVLVVQGDEDLIRVGHAVEMHTLIKGSQLCILPATTHFVLFENPELIQKAVLDFLLKRGPVMRMKM